MKTMRNWLGMDRAENETGLAMVLVIGVGSVMTILMVAAVAFTVGGLKKAGNDQHWNGALAAAYAGVEEYQSRLANDPSYMKYGNPSATFSLSSSVILPTGAEVNPAFGVGATGTWADVAGSESAAHFRYEVDSSEYLTTGTIHLRSTGRVADETRTIVADLRQQGFMDFLYFTDYEIRDPDFSGDDIDECVKYEWAGRDEDDCSEIAFGSGDVISGPAHSNDTIRICDATFEGRLTTGNNPASGLRYIKEDSNGNSCSGQQFDVPGSPAYSPVIQMPETNSQLLKEVRSDLPAEVANPGCLFTGPTKIRFHSDGTMTVKSPWTKKTQVAGSPPTSGTAPAACGIPGNYGWSSGSLGSTNGQRFAVPANNVIYIQNVPAVPANPNYYSTYAEPYSSFRCSGATGNGTGNGDGTGNGIGYPAQYEKGPQASASSSAYGCRNGDVFIEGTFDGVATIAAENYVYVTGNLVYEDSQDDLLGLIGNNAILVWNPITPYGGTVLGNTNRRIDAAMISVRHTFQVQNYDRGGNRGTLTVNGAIAQKFRGVVRGGSNGYAKHYVYDPRLRYTAPPKFLSPVTTTYGVNVWVEVSPIFNSDGTYR